MGRSGYAEDWDGDGDAPAEFYRQAVANAAKGKRGQALLIRLRDALDAMPVKRLITDKIKDEQGDVCAFGALDPNTPQPSGPYWEEEDHSPVLAKHFGIARALAAEIVYMNDEAMSWRSNDETPEARWIRMRSWVDEQIEKPQPVDAVDPVGERVTE